MGQRLLDRRHFLGAAALGTAGLGLAAACGGDDDDEAAAQETPVAPIPKPSGEVVEPRDAVLPAVSDQRTLDLVMTAQDDTVYDVAAGIPYRAWSFEQMVPAPALHLLQGDTVNFQLVNNGQVAHSMDFHAAQIDWATAYQSIQPGETKEFTWTADVPGAFMYHCGTPPVLHHIGNGMYGAVIVEPQNGFPEPADREFWLVQSEFYLKPSGENEWTGDMEKMLQVRPDFMAWNGTAFQYRDHPLQGKVGERIRFHVVNCGPTLWSAFHVIGALFDVVYVGGHPENPQRGLQTQTIAPGDGSTCDVIIPNPGTYPIVTHNFAYTELGIIGLLEVTE
ncbi:MAG: multicopper oxidase domain-containing protein [Dehalococcoidia bacterium]|nr:multicopper oxidase domain-containing protein [Dehalococcoidia bacterium]